MGICTSSKNLDVCDNNVEQKEVVEVLRKQPKVNIEEEENIVALKRVASDTLSSCSSTGSMLSDVDVEQWREEVKENRVRVPDDALDETMAIITERYAKVSIKINGKEFRVKDGITIFSAVQKCLDEKTQIPTLCYHPYLPCSRLYRGKCGICEVENEETGQLVRSCREKVSDGLSIRTNSEKVEVNIQRILKNKLLTHVLNCPLCPEKGFCSFEKLLQRYEISVQSLDLEQKKKYLKAQTEALLGTTDNRLAQNESLAYDDTKCLTCYRCLRICEYVQGMSKNSIAGDTGRNAGVEAKRVFQDIEDYHENQFASSNCIRCGMCSFVCPVGAIIEVSHVEKVIQTLQTKHTEHRTVVCQVAPSVRYSLPELYQFSAGKLNEKVLVASLKQLGFDYVFDMNFGADLYAIESAHEFLKRLTEGGPFPMYTSSCPAWVNMVEQVFPEVIPNLSTCKSPQAMLGAVIKRYWAKKMNLEKRNVIVVTIAPCVGKKSEIIREDVKEDIDYVITTRELGRMLRSVGVDLMGSRVKAEFDNPLMEAKPEKSPIDGEDEEEEESEGEGGKKKERKERGDRSVTSELHGVTGGLTESVLTALHSIMNKNNREEEEKGLQIKKFRGLTALKAGHVRLGEHSVQFAVVSGGLNIQKLLKKIKYDEESKIGGRTTKYFVECMACPGGCIGGGGNPKFTLMKKMKKRLRSIYSYVKKLGKCEIVPKTANKNKGVIQLYQDIFKTPNSNVAKIYLHSNYKNRRTEVVGSDDEDDYFY